jgi:SSS family solute:Na+ symporter
MIGGCEFISVKFGIGYDVALLIFAVLIAAYVVVGGLKGVMYTDALQGTIMFVGMVILLIYTYVRVGGFIEGHQHLTDLAGLVPGSMRAQGHQGWTSMPKFGWGSSEYNYWWIVVSTIVLGVGIGVLAQPQLVVRFMTVKSKKELNRAVLVGGIFILTMTGVAFVVGSLSNSYFTQHGKPYTGRVIKTIDEQKGQAVLQLVKRNDDGEYEGLTKPDGSPLAAPVVLDKDQPYLREVPLAGGGTFQLAQGRSISIVVAKGNAGKVIPMFLERAMPEWFSLVFLLTLLAAAMSTLSSQFHAVGTSIGRDIYESTSPSSTEERSILITRIGIILGIVIAVLVSYSARESTFIARATAIFFGLCASAFLPAFVGGLFWRKATKAGAIVSILVGFGVSAFWLVLVKAKEASTIGLVQKLTEGGKPSILADAPNWPVVDPLLVALPLSAVAFLVVSLLTRPPGEEHLSKCFKGSQLSTDK